jgi:hypothetical protein
MWRRGFVEFLAIFLGVSLSFLAEDWRETLRDRSEADRVLAGLMADLEGDQVGLRSKIQIDSVLLQSGQWLLQSWDRDAPEDSIEAALDRLYTAGTYTPVRSEYASANSAGRLQLIESADLRAEIVAHYETSQPHQQVVNRMQLDLVFEVWRRLRPYLQFGEGSAGPLLLMPPGSLFVPWSEIRRDQQLRNTLVEMISMTRVHLLQLNDHLIEAERIREAISVDLSP